MIRGDQTIKDDVMTLLPQIIKKSKNDKRRLNYKEQSNDTASLKNESRRMK
jgi:hypothetical protein